LLVSAHLTVLSPAALQVILPAVQASLPPAAGGWSVFAASEPAGQSSSIDSAWKSCWQLLPSKQVICASVSDVPQSWAQPASFISEGLPHPSSFVPQRSLHAAEDTVCAPEPPEEPFEEPPVAALSELHAATARQGIKRKRRVGRVMVRRSTM
jgi:hypothetical protein